MCSKVTIRRTLFSQIELWHGDSLELLPTLPEESYDLLLTDPPYYVLNKHSLNKSWDIDPWDTLEAYFSWTVSWLCEAYRVMKPGASGYVFWSQKYMESAWELFRKARFQVNRMLIWHHPNLAKPTSKMYLWTYDPIFYISKGTPKHFSSSFLSRKNVDVFNFPKPQNWAGGRKRYHSAEKPIELCKILIENSTQEGELVLDPFVGSGTTCIAASLIRRDSLGIEKDSNFFSIAVDRCHEILETQQELTLF